MHLAGHTNFGNHLIDTHDGPVIDPSGNCFDLHGFTEGPSTLLEWDARIPDFSVVHNEILKAKRVLANSFGEALESIKEGPTNFEERTSFPHPALYVAAQAE